MSHGVVRRCLWVSLGVDVSRRQGARPSGGERERESDGRKKDIGGEAQNQTRDEGELSSARLSEGGRRRNSEATHKGRELGVGILSEAASAFSHTRTLRSTSGAQRDSQSVGFFKKKSLNIVQDFFLRGLKKKKPLSPMLKTGRNVTFFNISQF